MPSNRTPRYDSIVIGLGGMGSAATYHLATRGESVLGLEQYGVPHNRGSSHGVSRMIRRAYPKHAAYNSLVERAYELWRDLETDHDQQLLYTNGTIHAGEPNSELYAGIRETCRRLELPFEDLSAEAVNRRFPGYQLPPHYRAVHQPDGGFLWPDQCLTAHVRQAHAAGADIQAHERVEAWRHTTDGVSVTTNKGHYEADTLVVAGGAWTHKLVDELDTKLVPERQVLGWFLPDTPEQFSPDRFPAFQILDDDEHYYGFPQFRSPGIKVGLHHHLRETVDPDEMEREPTAEDERVLREFAERYFSSEELSTTRLATCLYTNTETEDFVVDHLPNQRNVVVAAGFSGHGFKFCSVIGEIVADLLTKGESAYHHELFAFDSSVQSGSSVGRAE